MGLPRSYSPSPPLEGVRAQVLNRQMEGIVSLYFDGMSEEEDQEAANEHEEGGTAGG